MTAAEQERPRKTGWTIPIVGALLGGAWIWATGYEPAAKAPNFHDITREQADDLTAEIQAAGSHCPAVNYGRLEVDHYGEYLVLDCGPATDRTKLNGVSYKRYIDGSRPVTPLR